MNVLILLMYYNRPNLLKLTLNSIKQQKENNWVLAFIDDGSSLEGRPVVEKYMKDYLDKITFYNTKATIEDKLENKFVLKDYLNQAIDDSGSDVIVPLNDDDALFPGFITKLIKYYKDNKNIVTSYNSCKSWDYYKHTYEEALSNQEGCTIYDGTSECNGVKKIRRMETQQTWQNKPAIRYPNNILFGLDSDLYFYINKLYHEPIFNGLEGQLFGKDNTQLSDGLVKNHYSRIISGLKQYLDKNIDISKEVLEKIHPYIEEN